MKGFPRERKQKRRARDKAAPGSFSAFSYCEKHPQRQKNNCFFERKRTSAKLAVLIFRGKKVKS